MTLSDEQELGCKDCWNKNEGRKWEYCGIKAISPDTIMCIHHPDYIMHMDAISPLIIVQLAIFKIKCRIECNEICEDEDNGNCGECESRNRTEQLRASGYL